MSQLRDDRGSVSAFVLGLVMTFVACAGLAVDGGRVISARIRAADRAENAARVGAQAVTNIRLGIPRVDQQDAVRLARKFLLASGAHGSVTANGVEVCVIVNASVPMTLLALIGTTPRRVAVERCARPVTE